MILWYTVCSVFAPLQKALIYNRKWGVSSFMDSINEVMEAVKAYCKEKTSDATYAFYIKDIKATKKIGIGPKIEALMKEQVLRLG